MSGELAGGGVEDWLDRVKIRVDFPDMSASDQIRGVTHDLRASVAAFATLIEDFELSLSSEPTERQLTKLNQLRARLRINKKIIERLCAAMTGAGQSA